MAKKVVALIGTQSRSNTYRAVQQFEARLKELGEVDFEYAFLSDYHLEFCRGCKLCFDRGEEHCPIKDDRDTLLQKLEQSDGVVFATPNYAFQLSARMKNFFDRTAFIYHRPRFFRRPCTAIVTQGIFGGGTIVKYLCTSGENMGFSAVKGCCVNTLEPMTDVQQRRLTAATRKAADRFNRALARPAPAPSLFRLMLFRIARTRIKALSDEYLDHRYYRDMGWYESRYYWPAPLGLPKRVAGMCFDVVGQLFVRFM